MLSNLGCWLQPSHTFQWLESPFAEMPQPNRRTADASSHLTCLSAASQEKECALSDLDHQLQQLASPQAQLARLSPPGPSAAAAAESTGMAWQVAVAARDAEIEELHCELMEVRGQHLLWVLIHCRHLCC